MILWEQSYYLHFLWERFYFFLLIIGPSSDHCLAFSPAHSIIHFVDPLPNMWHLLKLLHGFIKVVTYNQYIVVICVSCPLLNQTNFKISKLLNLHLNWSDFVTYGLVLFWHQNPVSKAFFANTARLCNDEAEVWAKVVDWVETLNLFKLFNAAVSCAFGYVFMI